MSGKWFSNRGQMVQVACAVIAAGIGIITQWKNISSTIDVGLVIKIALYPVAAVALVQLGMRLQKARSSAPDQPARSCPIAWCSFLIATTIAGQGRACQVATAGNPTMGLSLMGAMVSSVM